MCWNIPSRLNASGTDALKKQVEVAEGEFGAERSGAYALRHQMNETEGTAGERRARSENL
jgi:hypothetical protein